MKKLFYIILIQIYDSDLISANSVYRLKEYWTIHPSTASPNRRGAQLCRHLALWPVAGEAPMNSTLDENE